jgi:hypothetical protein
MRLALTVRQSARTVFANSDGAVVELFLFFSFLETKQAKAPCLTRSGGTVSCFYERTHYKYFRFIMSSFTWMH